MTDDSEHTETLGVRTALEGECGLILLDRPRALNALTGAMIRQIESALQGFERDPRVRLVSIGSTRDGCFCAGGDIRAIREARLAGRHDEADSFFAEEFALNLHIGNFTKPYIALVDGICMGGGLGLSVHGTHRVVTERLVMAMPETAIGYFPDVGASYFLNTLPPGQIGLYLALTGARISAVDALYCGFATACLPHLSLHDLSHALTALDCDIEQAIDRWRILPAPGLLEMNRALIDRCFAADTIQDIRQRLRIETEPFAAAAVTMLDAAAPASLEITLDLLRKAKGLTLGQCLNLELAMAHQVTRSADFIEGVRAILIDKDRQPRWEERN